MSELAAIIRDNLPALVEEYDRRLRELAGYATLPTALRRSAAQVTFDFLVNWLETGDVDDDQRLVDFVRQTTRERANQGLDASSMHQGLRALDTIIDSWLTEMSDARLFWHAIAKAHEIINYEAADRHSGAESRLRQMVDRSPQDQLVFYGPAEALAWKARGFLYERRYNPHLRQNIIVRQLPRYMQAHYRRMGVSELLTVTNAHSLPAREETMLQ